MRGLELACMAYGHDIQLLGYCVTHVVRINQHYVCSCLSLRPPNTLLQRWEIGYSVSIYHHYSLESVVDQGLTYVNYHLDQDLWPQGYRSGIGHMVRRPPKPERRRHQGSNSLAQFICYTYRAKGVGAARKVSSMLLSAPGWYDSYPATLVSELFHLLPRHVLKVVLHTKLTSIIR